MTSSPTKHIKPVNIQDLSAANTMDAVVAKVASKNIGDESRMNVRRSGSGRMSTIVAFLGLVIVLFTSCNNTIIKDPLEYMNEDFALLIEGKVDETEISANIRYNHEENSDNSRIVITFLDPQSIKDIIITIHNDEPTARLGNIQIDAPELIEIADPFLCLCNKQEIHSVQRNKSGETVVKVTDNDADLVFIFEEEEKYPTKVRGTYHGRAVDFTIKSLEGSDQKPWRY